MLAIFAQHKIFVGITVAVLAIGLWYTLSAGGPAASESLLSSTAVTDPASAGVVETLITLRSIKLDGAIFAEPAFQALRDFSTPITPEPVGRPNPFASLSPQSAQPSAETTKRASIFTKPGKPSGKPSQR